MKWLSTVLDGIRVPLAKNSQLFEVRYQHIRYRMLELATGLPGIEYSATYSATLCAALRIDHSRGGTRTIRAVATYGVTNTYQLIAQGSSGWIRYYDNSGGHYCNFLTGISYLNHVYVTQVDIGGHQNGAPYY